MDYTRKTSTDVPPLERIENFNEFHIWLSREEQQTQAARCMDCGVPFCQAGMMIGGMASGCPLNNLIPEWNDLVYQGKWELALRRLRSHQPFPGVHQPGLPRPVRGRLHLRRRDRQQRHRPGERARHRGDGLTPRAGSMPPRPRPARGKSVAVIGSGPSGLSVAEYLNMPGPRRHRLRAG